MGKKGGGKGKGAAPAHTEEIVNEVEETSEGEEVEVEDGEGEEQPLKKAGEETEMEEVLERHRREVKEMKNEVQRLKKQVTQGDKKKKKDIQTEIEKIEEATAKRHQAEIAAFKAQHKGGEVKVATGGLEEKTEGLTLGGEEEDEEEEENPAGGKRVSKAQKKKNKKEEKNNEIRRQAEEEAAKAPNLKQIEEEKIAQACTQLGLEVKQVRELLFPLPSLSPVLN